VDGSDDERCAEVASEYDSVRYFKQKSKGLYPAMNEGIDLALGDSVIFMNSGDTFHREFDIGNFSIQFRHLFLTHAIFGDVFTFFGSFSKIKRWDCSTKPGVEWLPSHQAVFVPRKLLKEIRFDSNKSVSSDSELLIKVFAVAPYQYVPEIICNFELGGVSTYPRSLKLTFIHCKELVSTRKIDSRVRVLLLYFRQFVKLFLIKLIGFENYLKMSSRKSL
jgi:glycosyltransferase involved in cell wall biosynthesis